MSAATPGDLLLLVIMSWGLGVPAATSGGSLLLDNIPTCQETTKHGGGRCATDSMSTWVLLPTTISREADVEMHGFVPSSFCLAAGGVAAQAAAAAPGGRLGVRGRAHGCGLALRVQHAARQPLAAGACQLAGRRWLWPRA